MEVRSARKIAVADRSQIAEARRFADEVGRGVGFGVNDLGRLAIVVTEAATNLVLHSGGGEIVLQGAARDDTSTVDVLALDRGPGIANVAEAQRDGFTTRGSPGSGLGAIERQSDEFDMHSAPGVGTAVFARLTAGATRKGFGVAVGGISVPKTGETVCGDGWTVMREGDRLRVFVADGLGHGPLAADAASIARDVFFARARLDPADALGLMHEALRPTRGAAVAIADIHLGRDVVRYAGVGNIAASIQAGATSRSMVSVHGTVGHDLRKIQEFQYPWEAGARLVMHSDGLVTSWSLEGYRGLDTRHPALIAAVLYRDFQRGRDDTTVVVLRDER